MMTDRRALRWARWTMLRGFLWSFAPMPRRKAIRRVWSHAHSVWYVLEDNRRPGNA
jgi:hypothetical protein